MKNLVTALKAAGAAAFLCFAPTAFAEDEDVQEFGDESSLDSSTASEALAVACFRFDGRPRLCQNQGCVYNFRTNRCVQGRIGGARSYFICDARDTGWEEHFRGHRAAAWTQLQARNSALAECRRFHGRCYVTNCTIQR
jgi:hypothetical protein